MNLTEIFKLFSSPQPTENDDESLLIDFSDHPLYWIGGFNKMISNYKFIVEYLNKSIPEVNNENVKLIGQNIMYQRAWGYVKKINLNNQFHVECIHKKASKDFLNNLEIIILFFEKLEEYEKCALLKGISDKVKESLN